ncbi:hypothetical protein ACIQEY_25210 [Streptomyces parvus]
MRHPGALSCARATEALRSGAAGRDPEEAFRSPAVSAFAPEDGRAR